MQLVVGFLFQLLYIPMPPSSACHLNASNTEASAKMLSEGSFYIFNIIKKKISICSFLIFISLFAVI